MLSTGRVILMCTILCLLTLPLVARSDAATDQSATHESPEASAEARLLGPPPHPEDQSEEALERYREELEHQREALERGREDAERRADMEEYDGGGHFDRARHMFDREELENQIEALEMEHDELEAKLDELEEASEHHRPGRERAELHEEIERVERELQEREGQLTRLHWHLQQMEHEHGMEVEGRELDMMRERLEYVSGWEETVFDPSRAVVLATQSLVELSEDEPEEVIEVLEGLVEEVPGIARNVIRFALKDLYLRLDDKPQAARQMALVIRENTEIMARLHP